MNLTPFSGALGDTKSRTRLDAERAEVQVQVNARRNTRIKVTLEKVHSDPCFCY